MDNIRNEIIVAKPYKEFPLISQQEAFEKLYDEEFGYYICDVNLDEDEMSHFLRDTFYHCPYFQMNDEYKIVRKQM